MLKVYNLIEHWSPGAWVLFISILNFIDYSKCSKHKNKSGCFPKEPKQLVTVLCRARQVEVITKWTYVLRPTTFLRLFKRKAKYFEWRNNQKTKGGNAKLQTSDGKVTAIILIPWKKINSPSGIVAVFFECLSFRFLVYCKTSMLIYFQLFFSKKILRIQQSLKFFILLKSLQGRYNDKVKTMLFYLVNWSSK